MGDIECSFFVMDILNASSLSQKLGAVRDAQVCSNVECCIWISSED